MCVFVKGIDRLSRNKPTPFPTHQRLLVQLGERLRLARKRRKLTTGQVAERAGISRSTLYHLEKGEANSSLGTLLQVLVSLRLEDDLTLLGKDDVLGQRLMDAQLLGSSRKRPPNDPRKKTASKDEES
jgi:transcriptional regulator with XRE-family HTH domain